MVGGATWGECRRQYFYPPLALAGQMNAQAIGPESMCHRHVSNVSPATTQCLNLGIIVCSSRNCDMTYTLRDRIS